MKALVIADSSGRIVGVGHTGEAQGDDAPSLVEVTALDGLAVHQVDLPARLAKVGTAVELHEALSSFRVEASRGPRLVERYLAEGKNK